MRSNNWLQISFLLAATGATFFALAPAGLSPRLGTSDSVTHGLVFFGLAAFAAMCFPTASLVRIWIGLALLGGLIELLQGIPLLERGPSLTEWIVDMAAAGAALLCCRIGSVRAGSPDADATNR